MQNMTVGFEFEIGEAVYHRARVSAVLERVQMAIVIGQIAERCHGGCIQIGYVTSPALDDRFMIPECCLSREKPEKQK